MSGGFSKQTVGYILLTFFLWGSIYAVGKLIAGDVPPFLLACLRCAVGVVPLAIMAKKYWHMPIDKADRKWFILGGFFGYFMNLQLVQLGIYLTGASVAALINSLTPVTVAILAAFLLKEKITPVKCLCIVLAIAGTLVVSGGASGKNDIYGIICMIAAMCAFSVTTVAMRRLAAKYPPILITMYMVVVGLAFDIPVGVYTALTQPVNVAPRVVCIILYLGIFGTGLAQFSWAKCLSILPASTCSLFYPLQAISSALLGSVILGETFTPYFFWGLALITLDIFLNGWETNRLAKTSH